MLHEVISLDRRHRALPVAGQSDIVLFVPLALPRHVEIRTLLPRVERLTFQFGRLAAKLETIADVAGLHLLASRWDAVVASGSQDRPKDLLNLLVGLHSGECIASRQTINCAALNERLVHGALRHETDADIESLLQSWHQILMYRIAMHGDGGVYRTRVPISAGFLVDGGRLGPPPPDRVAECMRELANFIVEPTSLPFLIRLAMAWGQFLAIAPFSVGDEAICHAMVITMFGWEGYPPIFMSDNIVRCDRSLLRARQAAILQGDWVAWCEAALDVIENSIRTTEAHLSRIARLPLLWRERLDAMGLHAHSNAYSLLPLIITNPVLDAVSISRMLQVSRPSANAVLSKLIDAEIVTPYLENRKKRMFYAAEVLAAFDESALPSRWPSRVAASDACVPAVPAPGSIDRGLTVCA